MRNKNYEKVDILSNNATIRNYRIIQKEVSRKVGRDIDFYSLDAIISVGYCVNSVWATQFRHWATRLDMFLNFDECEILQDKGKISQEIAQSSAENEFEKYWIVEDRLFELDFDREIKQLEKAARRLEEAREDKE